MSKKWTEILISFVKERQKKRIWNSDDIPIITIIKLHLLMQLFTQYIQTTPVLETKTNNNKINITQKPQIAANFYDRKI